MKAVVVSAIGGPETLALADAPDLSPSAGEIMIEVRFSGINFAEALARRGKVPTPPPPFVMGLEVVGTVAAIGQGVSGFTVGQPVAAFGRHGYAQFTCVPAVIAVPLDLPGRAVSLEDAVGVPCTGVTAHQLLSVVAMLKPGQTVFVHGATGGVGTMLGQQAKALGAGRVIGSVGSEAKASFALANGYDEVIGHDEFETRLKEMTGGKGVDLFLEGISGKYLAEPAKCLAPLGRAIYYGDVEFTSDTLVGLSQLRSGSWTISGYSLGGLCAVAPQLWRPSAEAVLALIVEGLVSFGQVTRFAPTDAAKAHEALESRASYGKMCLDWSLL